MWLLVKGRPYGYILSKESQYLRPKHTGIYVHNFLVTPLKAVWR